MSAQGDGGGGHVALALLEDLVADGCPACGERRQDWLVWTPDGEAVRCATCGALYTPGGAP